MISNAWLSMVVTLVLCIVWMRIISLLTDRQVIGRSFSRKLIHIGTGPIFVLCWMLFPDKNISRYLAALVPFLIALQLFLVGKGKMQDRTSILAMARSGEKSELLKGPLLYGIVFVLITVFFWKSIHAVVALMILCGGDGIADIAGNRLKSPRLPWTKSKTVAGSISMFLGGILLVLAIIVLVRGNFLIHSSVEDIILPLILISFLATLVESFTPSDWDNLTVTGVSLVFSLILL
jgi:phytol kinase